MLAIDPEDLQAHYNLMLCFQGLGDRDGVQREAALRAIQGRRGGAVDHRAPTASCIRRTTTSGRQIHEHVDGAREASAYAAEGAQK